MRLISSQDLFERLQALRDEYRNSENITDHAIAVGIDRAITELVLSPTEGRKK